MHSLRLENATTAVAAGILDQSFKKHGRWKSEKVKDGYIKEMQFEKLTVSKQLGLLCVLTSNNYTSLFSKSDHFFSYPIQCIALSGKYFMFVWVKRIAYLNLDHQCIYHWYWVVFVYVKEGVDMFFYGWMSFNYDWLSKIVVSTHEKRSYSRTGVTWKLNI